MSHPPCAPQTSESTAFALAAAARHQQQARQRRRHQPNAARRQAHEQRLSPTQLRGLQAETRAIEWLQARGLTLLANNLRCPYGELDAVFRADANTMVIVEIRLRRSGRYGGAAASITPAKQERLRKTAAWYLPRLAATGFGGRTPRCRFDAICIDGDTFNWLKAAF